MRNFFATVVVIVLAAAYIAMQSGASSTSASPLDLPAVKRTAIYAPVAATQQASGASSQAAIAQARADEAEAARVYVQAQNDERNKARAVATEQAALATKTTNDAAVSKEYATLAAVSLQATAQAISNTIETDRVAYAARQAEIMATKQAATDAMLSRAQTEGVNAERDRFMTWVPVVVCLPTVIILIAIALYGLYLAVKRIGPQVDNSAIEQLRDEIEALRRDDDEPEPLAPLPDPRTETALAKKRAGRALAVRYVADSIRESGGKATKLLSAREWEALSKSSDGKSNSSDNHTAAVGYLRDELSAVFTQQGGPDQGTRVNESVGDLASLAERLATTPPP